MTVKNEAKAKAKPKSPAVKKKVTAKTQAPKKVVTKVKQPEIPLAMPQVGQRAPAFTMDDDIGNSVSLKSFNGKTVVLYFYPKDNTSGCTTEALAFRDLHKSFTRAGAVVLGVSPDTTKVHAGFRAKHGLPFSLLVDDTHKVGLAYGVWGEKSMYGRKYMGMIRATFLIDKNGKVANVWPKVKVDGHAEAVLEALKSL